MRYLLPILLSILCCCASNLPHTDDSQGSLLNGPNRTVLVSIPQTSQSISTRVGNIYWRLNMQMINLTILYNSWIEKNGDLNGTININFLIAPAGNSVNTTIESSTTSSPGFDNEVLNSLKKFRFRREMVADTLPITIPFTFSIR
jgi:TonB family protein